MLENLEQGNLTFLWAFEFVKELANNGLRHAVLSPGSRSTPLTLAFSAHPGIEKHIVLDERSAGFMALGIAKASGKPAALVCTSGTAAANYFPAVIESRMSETPLIVLTADRPPKYRYVGASQAIDQLKIYGDYPVLFFEAGEPVAHETDFDRIRWLACQTYQNSINKNGPAHINFPFRKPLEPSTDFYTKIVEEITNESGTKKALKTKTFSTKPDKNRIPESVIRLMQEASRPVVVAGPMPAFSENHDILDFLKKFNAPVLAEASSQLSGLENPIKGFDGFLRNEQIRNELKPDLIIRFGSHPVSKGLDQYLETHKSVPSILFSDTEEWHDSTFSTDYIVNRRGSFSDINLTHLAIDANWTNRWQNLSEVFVNKRSEILDASDILTDGKVYLELVPHIPSDWNIFLSNSFPVRDFDLFGTTGKFSHQVFVSRGASGIDGVTSTAIGTTIESKKNGVLFIGDLAFLHDTNALLSSPFIKDLNSLVIVIINNNGGNIFRMLPVSKHTQIFKFYFETPQHASISHLASSYNINYELANIPNQIVDTFKRLSTHRGLSIMECVTDPDLSMNQRREIWNFQ